VEKKRDGIKEKGKKKHLIQTEFAAVAWIKAMASSCERGNELSCSVKCERLMIGY